MISVRCRTFATAQEVCYDIELHGATMTATGCVVYHFAYSFAGLWSVNNSNNVFLVLLVYMKQIKFLPTL